MIETWSSYSVADLVMFSPETYLRLFERANAIAWPAYLLVVTVLAWSLIGRWDRRRFIAAYMVMAFSGWLVAAWFLIVLYAPINPFARWAALVFAVQGALLLVAALSRPPSAGLTDRKRSASWPGALLVTYGLLIHPLIGWLDGRPAAGLEWVGVAPDPTALVMIGVVLLTPWGHRWGRWVLWSGPLAWCLASALTLYGLGMRWPFLSLLAAVVAIAAAGLLRRTHRRPGINRGPQQGKWPWNHS